MNKIPELMTSLSGEKITTAKQWEDFRRPEIMNLFKEYIYGVRVVERPKDLDFEVVETKADFCGKGVTFSKILVKFMDYSFKVWGYAPEKSSGKMPAFVYVLHEFEEERTDLENGLECEYIDFDELFARGYAVFIMPTSGIYPDFDHDAKFKAGVHALFTPNVEDRKANSWATISSWAWGASRVMDYIETLDNIDSSRVSVCGHSRGGKTALWCGATDERFMCAVSNNSGCTGAAMHRTKIGEHIKDINRTDWFCENYHKFNDAEEFLPVDQHMLIAAMAPRLVYVSSSSQDDWADPKAERLSCRMAEPAYELYGKKGVVLPEEEDIEIDVPYHEGSIGYHVMTGEHSITHFDWKMFLDFLDKKQKN